MSRIGNREIKIPENVNIIVSEKNNVVIEGPKGKLEKSFSDKLSIKIDDSVIKVHRNDNNQKTRMLHGTTAALINNMILGVTQGYTTELEIVGVGYRASIKGKELVMNLGFSHPIVYKTSDDVKIEVPAATKIIVSGIDKEKVGETVAQIRAYKKPEPYKGKGIRYKNEKILRKEGKTAAKK